MLPAPVEQASPPQTPHPRRLGWVGTAAVALGGSNQSLFLITTLYAGQGDILGVGSAAVPLLALGLLLSWAAMPGWIELTLMYPNRVGGIAATCAEAFRPYSPILGTLTGVCYWWGWVPTCGLTAILAATAIHHLFLTSIPVNVLASLIVIIFTIVNLCGIQWVARLAIPSFIVCVALAIVSSIVPILTGSMDWHQATTYELIAPFQGIFGKVTAAMAGLYFVGFAAPAFEQSCCHVGEMVDPNKTFPKTVYVSALVAGLFFIVLPIVWLGVLGLTTTHFDMIEVLGATFTPLFGLLAPAVALGFIMFNMFHGTMAPLAGASRTLSQLADDGLLPHFLSKRCKSDAPLSATLLTAAMAIGFLWLDEPIWIIAAANLTYLIGICMPNIAVWLLRRNEPEMQRPYRAPKGTIGLGLFAACGWAIAIILGFEQFGLETVTIGIGFAYAGAALFAWRKFEDRKRAGLPRLAPTLHVKLTGTMIAVLVLDTIGYLIALSTVPNHDTAQIAFLSDLFVVVALLTLTVGLVLPGMIAHAAGEVSKSARQLSNVTLMDFRKAIEALAKGDLDHPYTAPEIRPVVVLSNDELGEMADSFNRLQHEVERSMSGLNDARENLKIARQQLEKANEHLEERVSERTQELQNEVAIRIQLNAELVAAARRAGMADVATNVLHNVGNVLTSINVSASLVEQTFQQSALRDVPKLSQMISAHENDLATFLTNDPKGKKIPEYLQLVTTQWQKEQAAIAKELRSLTKKVQHVKSIIKMQQSLSGQQGIIEQVTISQLINDALAINEEEFERSGIHVSQIFDADISLAIDKVKALQILINLIKNAKAALMSSESGNKQLTLQSKLIGDEKVQISVIDSGLGIDPKNITKIFSHGFTTKKDGHGFGLHSSAISAQEMGGSLKAFSQGLGKGATFILELPLKGQQSNEFLGRIQ